MHITEGIVTGVPAIVSSGIALGLVGVGARKMQAFTQEHPEKKPLLGMAGAFIFFISLIPIPAFNGTCSHPCGTPLAGILLGPWIGIALSGLSLLLQAAFFAHGGFSTWGVNVLSLGVGGAFFGWAAFALARRMGQPLWMAGALGGLIGDLVTYLISGGILGGVLATGPQPQFTLTGYLLTIYGAYAPSQIPIALGEMALTALTLHYIYQQRPEILESLKVTTLAQRTLASSVLPFFLLLFVFAMPLAIPMQAHAAEVTTVQQQAYTGMDAKVNEQMAEQAGLPPHKPLIDTEKMGDLWNTLLLLAGGLCGFIIGRSWDTLFARKPSPQAPSRPAEER